MLTETDSPITINHPLQASSILMHAKSNSVNLQSFSPIAQIVIVSFSPVSHEPSSNQSHQEPLGITSKVNDGTLSPFPPQIPFHHPTYVSPPHLPNQDPLTWIEQGLQSHATFIPMTINSQEVWIIFHNPNFLAQLISEGMTLDIGNYINHMWLANILELLAPALATILFHNIQVH